MNIEDEISKYNNAPLERLSGLSPKQTHGLIHDALRISSCIKFNYEIDNGTLDQIPFFRLCEELLKIIKRDGFIKLTPLGSLTKKNLVELYNHKFILDEIIENGMYKLHSEDYCISVMSARIVCELTNLVKKNKGKLLLTKNGERCLLDENRVQLFKEIFLTFTEKFNWGFHDGFTAEPVSQYGYLFSIYLLKKYGAEEQKVAFYAKKYLQVFEKSLAFFTDTYATPEKQFSRCYSLRTFERFTEWFGFTNLKGKGVIFDRENFTVIKTPLLDEVFMMENK